jgi:protein-disulfide isomerase
MHSGTRILLALAVAAGIGVALFYVQRDMQQNEAARLQEAERTAVAERENIEGIVREYLLANPEVIEEAANALREKRELAAAAETERAIDAISDKIFTSANQMVLGNPDGPITLVEFFDYNCGYCKRALSDMTALLEANPDLRIVMKEFPILSEGSLQAARVSVAVKDLAPDKYLAFHQELMTRPGEATSAKALEVVRDLGLDAAVIETAANADDVTGNIKEVHELAAALGITGTPSYIIGKELIPGAIGYDGLQERVAAMRECGLTVC